MIASRRVSCQLSHVVEFKEGLELYLLHKLGKLQLDQLPFLTKAQQGLQHPKHGREQHSQVHPLTRRHVRKEKRQLGRDENVSKSLFTDRNSL